MTHKSRNTFGQLFQSVFLTGLGAEIGVQTGHNSLSIFESGWLGELACIDNWVRPHELEEAKKRLADKDVTFIKSDSAKAADRFLEDSLDWIYHDADHSYNGLKRDYNAWFSKVRSGGIIAGHDYAPESHKNDCDGVRQFIDEFMQLNPEIEVHFTTDDFYVGDDKNIQGNEYQSWWFIKP